jgi:hypothetical protein
LGLGACPAKLAPCLCHGDSASASPRSRCFFTRAVARLSLAPQRPSRPTRLLAQYRHRPPPRIHQLRNDERRRLYSPMGVEVIGVREAGH